MLMLLQVNVIQRLFLVWLIMVPMIAPAQEHVLIFSMNGQEFLADSRPQYFNESIAFTVYVRPAELQNKFFIHCYGERGNLLLIDGVANEWQKTGLRAKDRIAQWGCDVLKAYHASKEKK